MARRQTRRLILAAALVAAVAAGIGLWLGLRDGGHPSRRAYLAHVSTVCAGYARRVSRVGAPSDVAAYGDVIAAVGAVLPLLRAQVAAMRAVPAPAGLQPDLDRLFALDDSSIGALAATLTAARRRDAGGVAQGLVRFSGLRDRTHGLSLSLGIDCSASRAAAA